MEFLPPRIVPLLAAVMTLFLAAFAGAGGAMAQAAQPLPAEGNVISMPLSGGKLVRLARPAASVFVANPAIADVQVQSPTLVYLFAQKPGRTNFFAIDGRGRVLVDSVVSVTHDTAALKRSLDQVLPAAEVTAHSVETGILLTGSVSSPAEAEDARRIAQRFAGPEGEVINRLDVTGATQINLQVRVAEVNRSVSKQFGVNWEAIGPVNNFTFGLASGADILWDGSALTTTTNSLFGNYTTGSANISGLLEALETENLVTLLAEPNLTAMSGETASFLAGGEFPFRVPQENGAPAIQYKQFGISLSFKPQLVGKDRINILVAPEVSEISDSGVFIEGIAVPTVSTRRASTTVELASGQSFAIAGLLQNDSSQAIESFPFLGDLPVLGALFRSDTFRRDETELVIIVTPYLVRPVESAKLAVPQDGLVLPNDIERIIEGRTFSPQSKGEGVLSKAQTAAADGEPPHLVGPAGFILE